MEDKKRRMDSSKMLWHMDRVHAYFDRGERIAPLYIDMGITKTCNINCVYCYGVYQNLSGEKIKPEVLIQFCHDAPLVGVKAVGIIGDGEPTMNPGLYDALDEGAKGGLDMAISTNGLLLHYGNRLETVIKNCTWMRFNLSAGTREGYKKVHNADAFDKLIEIIRRAVQMKKEHGYKCDIGLQAVFVPKLMNEEMIAEAKLAVELGVDYFLIKQCSLPVANIGVNQVQFDPEDSSHPDVIKALKTCESLATPETDIVVKWNAMQLQQDLATVGRRPYNGCWAPPFLLQISGNGKIFPCGHLFGKDGDRFLLGDLHQMPFPEIIKSEQYWKIIKEMQSFDVHNACHGQCRHDSVNTFLYDYINRPMGVNFI